MSTPNPDLPTPAGAPARPSFARELGAEASSALADGVKDAVSGFVEKVLIFGGILLALVLPIGGLAIGVLTLLLAARSGRSRLLPLLLVAGSIFSWATSGTPLGALPALLTTS